MLLSKRLCKEKVIEQLLYKLNQTTILTNFQFTVKRLNYVLGEKIAGRLFERNIV